MAITTDAVSHQHFSGSNSDSVIFARTVNNLLLTTTGTISVSFDGGDNYMVIAAGTYQFNYIWSKTLFFSGSGTWSGCGISL